ncbi:hypothetical protein EXIGLDRAFT_847923, partial [Exidia glandulosa HHB12029]
MDPAQVSKILGILGRTHVIRCTHFAGAVLFLWEHIITSQEEFDVIWKSNWSSGKVLFLLQRYLVWPELIGALYADMGSLTGFQCRAIFAYHIFTTSATISMAHAILLMRTWALWRSNKCVVLALPVALTMFVVFIAYSTSRYVSGTTFVPAKSLSPLLSGCA